MTTKKTKMVSISAVAACAKADLVTEDFLKEVGLEVFQLSIKAESDELSREEGFLLFYGWKTAVQKFIKTIDRLLTVWLLSVKSILHLYKMKFCPIFPKTR